MNKRTLVVVELLLRLKSLKVAQKHGLMGDGVSVMLCVMLYGDVVW